MKAKYLLAVPAVALLIGIGGAATAMPVSTDPWATLPENPPGTAPQPRSMVTFDGNVFVANSQADTVTKILPTGQIDTTFNAGLPSGADPIGIAVDSAGNLYTADAGTFAVSKITPSGAVTAAYASLSAINAPEAITVDQSDNVFTANNDSTISHITPAGVLEPVYANLGSAGPVAIVSDARSTLYTVNQGDGTIGKIVEGSPAVVTANYVSLGSGLPSAIALAHDGTYAFVTNQNADTVSKLDLSGATTGAVIATYALPAGSMAQGVAVDASGNAYATDFNIAKVSMITAGQPDLASAATIQTLSDAGSDPEAITIDSDGNLYTAGFNSGTVSRLELAPAITSGSNPGSISVGVPFSYTVTASGVDPLSFDVNGALPAGLSLDSATGTISGTPTEAGSFSVAVRATNPYSTSESVTLTLVVASVPATPTTPPAPGGSGANGSSSGGSNSSGGSHLASTGLHVDGALPLGVALLALGAMAAVSVTRRRSSNRR